MMRILFVDLRNTFRSQIAEACFNQFADGWAKAFSAGTMPAATADPHTVQVLTECGAEPRTMVPKPINSTLLGQADIVVLMGKDVFPGAFTADYIWDFQDPTGRDILYYRIQRDAIRNQVQELIVELQRFRLSTQNADWITPAFLQRELLTQQMLRS